MRDDDDDDGIALDLFLHVFAGAVGAINLGAEGGLYMGGGDDLGALFGGEVIGFEDLIGNAAHMGGQPFRIVRQAGAVFDNAGHRRRIQRTHVFIGAEAGGQARLMHRGFAIAHHDGIEIGGHIEQFPELGIVAAQHIIKIGLAEQYDLGFERDRFRL